jgi:hypothetical protein
VDEAWADSEVVIGFEDAVADVAVAEDWDETEDSVAVEDCVLSETLSEAPAVAEPVSAGRLALVSTGALLPLSPVWVGSVSTGCVGTSSVTEGKTDSSPLGIAVGKDGGIAVAGPNCLTR